MRTASRITRTIAAGCLVLLLAGCTQPASSSGGSPGSAQPGSTAAEQPASTGSGGWMEGIPASVPPFSFGTMDNDQSSKMQAGDQTIYSLYYEGTKKEDVASYIEKLKSAGFEITPDNVTSGLSAAGELKKGSEKLIGLSISWQDGGHVDYTINVVKAGQ